MNKCQISREDWSIFLQNENYIDQKYFDIILPDSTNSTQNEKPDDLLIDRTIDLNQDGNSKNVKRVIILNFYISIKKYICFLNSL